MFSWKGTVSRQGGYSTAMIRSPVMVRSAAVFDPGDVIEGTVIGVTIPLLAS